MFEDKEASTKAQIDLKSLQAPILIIGAAYTGKSRLAHQILDPQLAAAVIGTGNTEDSDFNLRIQELKKERPLLWENLEPKNNILDCFSTATSKYKQVIFDSINQWIAQLTLDRSRSYSDEQLEASLLHEGRQLCELLNTQSQHSKIVLVTSEVGAGLSPPTALPRIYRQATSRVNCYLAEACATVVLVSAGIPLILKGGY